MLFKYFHTELEGLLIPPNLSAMRVPETMHYIFVQGSASLRAMASSERRELEVTPVELGRNSALCRDAIEGVHFPSWGGRISQALFSFCICKLHFVSMFSAANPLACLRSDQYFLPAEGKPAVEVTALSLPQLVTIRVGRTCQVRCLSKPNPRITEGKERDT